jgi:hypothetical protein
MTQPTWSASRARPIVPPDDAGERAQDATVPEGSGRDGQDDRLGHLVGFAGRGDPVEERPPGRPRGGFVEPLEDHVDADDVLGSERELFAPMGVHQGLAVEVDEAAHQGAVEGGRPRLDPRRHGAEEGRQFVGAQREAGHDAERATAAAPDGPEEIRLGGRIGDAHRAVGGDDLGLKHPGGAGPEGLGEAAEAAALDEAGDADCGATAALDIAAALGGHRLVGL